MNKLRQWALLALAGFGLSAAGAVTDTEWWSVNFESPSPNGVSFVYGELGNLTNSEVYAGAAGVQPYDAGTWYAIDSDDSYVTNGIVTNVVGSVKTETTSAYLKLDTQGNDLKWTPTNSVESSIALVDADLLLVGSDTPPDAADFDASGDVQTAIFLRNFIDADTGDTTNSLLYVYVFDGGTGGSYWQALEDVGIEDNSWHHVRVLVDYSGESYAQVSVYVDDMDEPLSANGDAATTKWTVANRGQNFSALNSVSFRGTGAVDNFVGALRKQSFPTLTFAAEVYIDGVKQAVDENEEGGNLTRYALAEAGDAGSGKTVEYLGFRVDDYDGDVSTYSLRTIEISDFIGGTNKVFNYTIDDETGFVSVDVENDIVTLVEEEGEQTGDFDIEAVTDGAVDSTNVIAKIYFVSIGAYNAIATTTVNGTTTTDATVVKPSDFAEGATKTLTWTFPNTDGANILTGVTVSNGATASYDAANGVATVTVTLTEALAADTTFAAATYAEGSYEGKTPSWIDNGNGSYVLGVYAAKIGSTFYETLKAALDAATAGEKVDLLVDLDPADLSVTNVNAVLDLGGHVIKGDKVLEFIGSTVTVSNGTICAVNYAVRDLDGSNVTLADGLEIFSANYGVFVRGLGLASETTTALTVSGASIIATNAFPVAGNNTKPNTLITINEGSYLECVEDDCAIYHPQQGRLVLNGGTIKGKTGIEMRNGQLEVPSDSTVEVFGTGPNNQYNFVNGASANPTTGDAIAFGATTYLGNAYVGDGLSASIAGGTFVSANAAGVGSYGQGNYEAIGGFVSGGSFSSVVPADLCAEGYVPVTTPDPVTGLYTVGTGAVQITIAGEVKTFGSIADAQAAAAAAEIADPVFTIVAVLSEETVTLASGETLKILVGEDGDVTALTVETSETDTAQYAYAVADETDAETGVTTYSVVQTTKTYEIVFNVDQVAVLTTNAPYGDTLYGPATDPTKASSESTDFAFAGWTNVLAGGAAVATADLPAVTTNATWDAVFTESAREYTITWTMDDDSVIDTTTVAYGATPTHADPTKASTAEFSYEFAGWSPEVVEVTGEATYKATFTATTRSYAVTFLDGTEEEGDDPFYATNVLYGATLYGPAADPTKASTAEKDFTFAGWTNAAIDAAVVATADLPAVAGEATYAAVFTESARTYEIVFNDADGTRLATTNAPYGDTLYGPADPAKAADAQFTYAFAGWTNAAIDAAVVSAANLPAVDAAATYTAVYTATVNEYTITWTMDDDSVIDTTTVAYGDTPTHADPTKESAGGYSYEFAAWTPEVAAVTGEATYKATFTATAIEYAIVYDLDGGSWPEGYVQTNAYTVESAAIVLPAPAKEGYAFLNWTNALGEVSTGVAAGSTGDQSFGAVFEEDATIEAVDPGESMSAAEKAANPPAEVIVDPDSGDVSFAVRFRGQAGVTYELVASPTLDVTTANWEGKTGGVVAVDSVVVTSANAGDIQTLTVAMGENDPPVRFFKIRASKTE
ncbi:MAG: hypothetical protein IJV65_07930 [Kiritimatiellae bacterium]|nr:hypothetical protein [Kiritimatiellia bacterium]